jgi:hypothetical protein
MGNSKNRSSHEAVRKKVNPGSNHLMMQEGKINLVEKVIQVHRNVQKKCKDELYHMT